MLNPFVIAAYVVSLLGGGVAALVWVVFLRRKIHKSYNWREERNHWLDWSIGLIERGVTTTLLLYAPTIAPAFVGGWVVLKFAANWDKRTVEKKDDQGTLARRRLTALVGSAVSISFAVIGALIVRPGVGDTWAH